MATPFEKIMQTQPQNLKDSLYPNAIKIETWQGKTNKNVYHFKIYVKDNPIPFTYTVSNNIANMDSNFEKIDARDFKT